ncbi:hypothetical protein CVT24_007419 [Panaeolus cyanescens]|uniref:Nephrocystin 3-like N-terminal domain-containing protein n=1 Tax=Panaeolus cyanescens TaxID=181874 RepID=A0A409YKY9_9AGAR|nr:hypothetical protein CVT24_007419 [Panaeolus cyanescens]
MPDNIAQIGPQATIPQPSMLHPAMPPASYGVLINEAPVDGLSNLNAAQGTQSQFPNHAMDLNGSNVVPTFLDPIIYEAHSTDSNVDIDHRLPLSPRMPSPQLHTLPNSSTALTSGQLRIQSLAGSTILITNAHFTTTDAVGETSRTSSQALRTLYEHIAPAAFHNSLQRCDPPKCHPGTREAIQRQILNFSDDPSKFSAVVMWLYGPAGAGKTAIAQTVAETLFKKKKLAASFFFSQMSKDGHRHHEKRLIATIAYQIMQNTPLVCPHIEHEIQLNPAIFDMSLEDQLTSLILQPFRKLGSEQPAEVVDKIPRTIIIDGLDECSDSAAQERVLKILRLLVGARDAHPFNVIVVSRPETNIIQWFDNKAGSSLAWRLNLQDSTEKDNDIAIFVTDELTAIAKSYRLKHHLPAGWPSKSVIDEIVGKSSGQFIYAATVVRYIQNCRGVPSTQLEALLSSTLPKKARPFAELDALYTSIITKSPYSHDLVSIMGALKFSLKFCDFPFDGVLEGNLCYVQRLLSLSAPFDVIVTDFSSLLDFIYDDPVSEASDDDSSGFQSLSWAKPFHKSLHDFITDSSRAPQGYHLNLSDFVSEMFKTIHGT